MTDFDFLTVDEVLQIHEEQIKAYGGIYGIRDQSLLESATMTPQATFGGEYLHQNLFEMAAAYTFHLAENQPFLDGNKRTALVSALVFLEINEITIIDPDGKLYEAMIAIANKERDKYDLAKLFETLT